MTVRRFEHETHGEQCSRQRRWTAGGRKRKLQLAPAYDMCDLKMMYVVESFFLVLVRDP